MCIKMSAKLCIDIEVWDKLTKIAHDRFVQPERLAEMLLEKVADNAESILDK